MLLRSTADTCHTIFYNKLIVTIKVKKKKKMSNRNNKEDILIFFKH